MVHNIADVVPGGTAKAISATRKPCNWVNIVAKVGNAAPVRIGDSTTGAASGMALAAGASIMFPPISDDLYIDLAQVFVYGTTTDSVSVTYGTH
jgi:hypothetical protein